MTFINNGEHLITFNYLIKHLITIVGNIFCLLKIRVVRMRKKYMQNKLLNLILVKFYAQKTKQTKDKYWISVLKNFAVFPGKQLCCILFLMKLLVFRAATLLKKSSNTGVFLWILQMFNNSFFIEHLWWLLLKSECNLTRYLFFMTFEHLKYT